MEVMIPSPSLEFDFGSCHSTPYVLTAPSNPKRFGDYYFSAPTSPSRMAEFYREFDEFVSSEKETSGVTSLSSPSIPFGWEEKPGKPKSRKVSKAEEDFAFSVFEDMERPSLSAEELFDGGKIRPLKAPPRLQLPDKYKISSTAEGPHSLVLSPRSSVWRGKMMIGEVLSPRRKSKDSDPFKAAKKNPEQERGRDRAPGSGSRAERSLSPYWVSTYPWEEEEKEKQQLQKVNGNQNQPLVMNTSISSSKGSGSGSISKKWRLKDFFLFRSASEGRAADKDPFRKYAEMFRMQEDTRNSSFCSTTTMDSPGSISRRRSGPVSAHELHYTVNKAVSDDLKKRTFLPYKQGILGSIYR